VLVGVGMLCKNTSFHIAVTVLNNQDTITDGSFAVFQSSVTWLNGIYIDILTHSSTHTYIHLTALCLGLPRWAGTRKVKPIWILLKQETVSGIAISWAICKSAPHSRQITTPAPHHLVFYRPDALPAAQPTASKHWIYLHTWTNL